jgi:hypothetical protein
LTNRQRALWRNTQALQQLDKDGRAVDQSLHVVVELVGEAAPNAPTIEHEPRSDDDGRDALRKHVQLIG